MRAPRLGRLVNNGSTFLVSTRTPPSGSATTSYDLVKVLGYGNMGTVFLPVCKGQDYLPSKGLALKVMNKEALSKNKCWESAAVEMECLCALSVSLYEDDDAEYDGDEVDVQQCPFFPRLHDYFETSKHLVLVMEFCPGGNLNSLRLRQPKKTFSIAALRFYAAEILLALEHLHQLGFVYRDLKPENLLIYSSGHIMLADFDLVLKMREIDKDEHRTGSIINKLKQYAKFSESLFQPACAGSHKMQQKKSVRNSYSRNQVTPLTKDVDRCKSSPDSTERLHSFVGTEEYMAPEILWRAGHAFTVDWWTLGILLYEMFYGITPFKSNSQQETFLCILCKEPKFPDLISNDYKFSDGDNMNNDSNNNNELHSYGISSGCNTEADMENHAENLRDLISKLLAKNYRERLGYHGGAKSIKCHPFFQGICWDALPFLSTTPSIPLLDINEHCERVNLEEHLAIAERRIRKLKNGDQKQEKW